MVAAANELATIRRMMTPEQLRGIVAATLMATAGCAGRVAETSLPDPGAGAFGDDAGMVFYTVFVPSFFDTDGDGVGDLNGVRARLDYLAELGVDGIALMPVFAADDVSGAGPLDLRQVASSLGTEESFDALVADAAAHDLKVLLHMVVNHTSYRHPWFQTELAGDPADRRWYHWRDFDPGWLRPGSLAEPVWHAAGDAGYVMATADRSLPDLNLRDPEIRSFMADTFRFWLGRGVDGFVIEDARHLIVTGGGEGQVDTEETLALLREWEAAIFEARPDAIVIHEIFGGEDAIDRYALPPRRVAVTDDRFRDIAVRSVASGESQVLAAYLDAPAGTRARHLAHPAYNRLAQKLSNDWASMSNAAALLATSPGHVFVYYGQEVGTQKGETMSDADVRTPMAWSAEAPGFGFTEAERAWTSFAPGSDLANVASQALSPNSLLARYRNLLALRATEPALSRGAVRVLHDDRGLLISERTLGNRRLVVAHNLSPRPRISDPLDLDVASLRPLFVDPGVALPATGEPMTMALPARASAVWSLE